MTPSDLIADLRDVHTPVQGAEAGWPLSPTPLVIFAALLAAGFLWSRWRKTNWKREGAARLVEAKEIADADARWTALTLLYRQVTRQAGAGAAPDYLFQPRGVLGPEADKRLIADIERRIR